MPVVDPSTSTVPDLMVRMMKGSDTEEYSLRTFQVFDVGFMRILRYFSDSVHLDVESHWR